MLSSASSASAETYTTSLVPKRRTNSWNTREPSSSSASCCAIVARESGAAIGLTASLVHPRAGRRPHPGRRGGRRGQRIPGPGVLVHRLGADQGLVRLGETMRLCVLVARESVVDLLERRLLRGFECGSPSAGAVLLV